MTHKFSWKMLLLTVSFLSSCFSMDKPEEKDKRSPYYAQAQDYFRLSNECNRDTEEEEKQEFAKWAIAELEQGIEKRERASIVCMMEFYKDGLGSVVERDLQKYSALKNLLQEENNKNLIQTLKSENHELENILEELIANLDKAREIQEKVIQYRIPALLKGGEEERQQVFSLMSKILSDVKERSGH
jgi:hypothetical protein